MELSERLRKLLSSHKTPVHSIPGSAVGAIASGRSIGGIGACGAAASGRSIGGIGACGAAAPGRPVGGIGAVGAAVSGRTVVGTIVCHVVRPVNDVFHYVVNGVPGIIYKGTVAVVCRAAVRDTVDVGVISRVSGCVVVSVGAGI